MGSFDENRGTQLLRCDLTFVVVSEDGDDDDDTGNICGDIDLGQVSCLVGFPLLALS